MKNKLYIRIVAIIVISVYFASPLQAQTPTAATTATTTVTPAPTGKKTATTKLEKDVQLLKDKIATKVAELRRENKTVVSGLVTGSDNTTITIQSDDDKNHKITYDESVTKLISVLKKTPQEIKIDNIKKDDYIIVSGLQIEDTMTATSIYIDQKYLVLTGKVSDVKKADFQITVVTTDKDTYTLDIESATKQFILNPKTNELVKSGFSKINVGDTVHFVVSKPQDKNTLNATAIRLLLIPQEYFVKK